MAIYHSTIKIIGRSSGRTAVGAAAYRAGEKIKNDYDGLTHDYTRKSGIAHSEIMLPDNAPIEYKDRATLWNAIEQAEKRKDAQTAREIELALPIELDRQEQVSLLREYIQDNFVNKGMCADFSLHDKEDGNPHAHIMLTTRSVTPDGFGKKERVWNDRQNVEDWRESWANICNRAFEKKSISERIDHRSYAEQGIEKEPTIHLGAAHKLEKRGIRTELGNKNREAQNTNMELEAIKDKLAAAFSERQEIEAAPMSTEAPEEILAGRENHDQPGAREAGENLASLENKYMDISGQLRAEQGKLAAIVQGIRERGTQRQSLNKDHSVLKDMKRKSDTLEETKAEMQSKGILHDKKAVKDIDRQLEAINKSREQARTSFREAWGIEPTRNTIEKKARELAGGISALKSEAAETSQLISQLQERKKAAEMEYKTELIIADMRPDREQVMETRERSRKILSGEPRGKESITERLERAKDRQQLDRISKADYQNIAERLKEISTDLACKVMQHAQNVIDRQFDRGQEM